MSVFITLTFQKVYHLKTGALLAKYLHNTLDEILASQRLLYTLALCLVNCFWEEYLEGNLINGMKGNLDICSYLNVSLGYKCAAMAS